MNMQQAEKMLREKLSTIYPHSEASQIADLAMEHISGFHKTQRISHADKTITPAEEQILHNVLSRLLDQEPIQYIMNKAWFYDMELYVDRDVLIPRPETEELVHWIISDIKASGKNVFEKKPTDADETTILKILDVGTGSGCIALSLKKQIPLAEVWGCDISDRALNVARRNGSELDVRVDFQSVDFLNEAQQKHLPSVDILVSNPPYVPLGDQKEMQPNVLQYEPHTALFVDDEDPLVFYKAILAFASHRLHPGGSIYMEIHENLGKEVRDLFESQGYQVELKKDMQGKERMVKVSSGQ